MADTLMPLLRDLGRDVKKVVNQTKLASLQGSDVSLLFYTLHHITIYK